MAGPSVMPARPRRHGAPSPWPAPAELARHVQEAAEIAGEQRAGTGLLDVLGLLGDERSEISGYLMQKVPPKPQQISAPGNSLSSSPSTLLSSRRGWALTP
jgi:hypothetical protein